MTSEQIEILKQKLPEITAYFGQAAADLETKGDCQEFRDSFANGSASFFYCRLVLGFND
jgi:hypothetical protein